jgi:hypothetical protein
LNRGQTFLDDRRTGRTFIDNHNAHRLIVHATFCIATKNLEADGTFLFLKR